MEGYKCDLCNCWFEGKPATKGYSLYFHHKHRPLNYITVFAKVTKEFSSNSLDLCSDCLIDCLDYSKESHKTKGGKQCGS